MFVVLHESYFVLLLNRHSFILITLFFGVCFFFKILDTLTPSLVMNLTVCFESFQGPSLSQNTLDSKCVASPDNTEVFCLFQLKLSMATVPGTNVSVNMRQYIKTLSFPDLTAVVQIGF